MITVYYETPATGKFKTEFLIEKGESTPDASILKEIDPNWITRIIADEFELHSIRYYFDPTNIVYNKYLDTFNWFGDNAKEVFTNIILPKIIK